MFNTTTRQINSYMEGIQDFCSYTPDNKNDGIIGKLEAYSSCGIRLDPRLVVYVRKKLYYKKYGIKPLVPLEKEFNISKCDIQDIKDALNDIKDVNYKRHKGTRMLVEPRIPLLDKHIPDNTRKSERLDNHALFYPDDKKTYYSKQSSNNGYMVCNYIDPRPTGASMNPRNYKHDYDRQMVC